MEITEEKKIPGLLSGNILKIIACITMAFDHVGVVLFPGVTWLRIVGRIAMPLFAYFVAEGCKYTRNRLKHFLLIAVLGLMYLAATIIAEGIVYCSIFLTFSLSVTIIYAMDWFKASCFAEEKNLLMIFLSFVAFAIAVAGSSILVTFVHFDYGMYGVMAPVAASLFAFGRYSGNAPRVLKMLDNRFVRIACMLPVLILLSVYGGFFPFEIQGYCLISAGLLLFYSEKRGMLNLKYAFYAFYPLHIAVIYVIGMLMFA